MASKKEYPYITHPIIKNAIGQVFPEFVDHKTDSRDEDKQESRQRPKKRRDDE